MVISNNDIFKDWHQSQNCQLLVRTTNKAADASGTGIHVAASLCLTLGDVDKRMSGRHANIDVTD